MVRIPLDFTATTVYADGCYGDARLPTGQAYCSYADDLQAATEKLWRRQFRNIDFILPKWQEMIEHSRHVCRMFALMSRFGRTYEEINDVTNVSVADLLAAVSYDPRLPLPKRDLDLRARVSEGGIAAQLISLADVSLTAANQTDWIKSLVENKLVRREQLEEAARVVSGQTAAMHALLDCLHAIPRRGPIRQWIREVDNHLGGVEAYLKQALRTRPHMATARNNHAPPTTRKRVPKCPLPTTKPKISSAISSNNSTTP